MPDFNRLKTDQAMNEEKVVEFFKASFKLPTSVEIVEGQSVVEGDDADGKKEKIFLPPTDRLSQLAIRYLGFMAVCTSSEIVTLVFF